MDAVLAPKQAAFTCVSARVKSGGSVTVKLKIAWQLLESSTSTVYVPAIKESISSVVSPVFQRYVYGEMPPVIARSIAPLFSPKQLTLVMTSRKE
jgi:hypothetical protein